MAIDFNHLLSNTLLSVTVLLSLVGWVIAFGAACAIGTFLADNVATTWWVIIFELILNLGIIYLIVSSTLPMYRLVVLAFLAVSISYLTGSIGTFVYSSNAAAAALSAGLIIMIIMQFLWVFIFGAEESSNFTTATAPFNGGTPMAFLSRNRGEKEEVVDTKSAGHSAPVGSVGYPEMNGHNGGVYQANHPSQPLPAGNAPASPGGVGSAAPLEYNQQVTALHAYQANPEDPTELSFTKGEALDVVECKGNWWQARKQDGTIGIVPSNYFAN
ncbi:hypothetical protein K450DRAFT_279425 [Umbelopsis ramanniana AG]|uniref:SH3 domain-containing protein n=1 Tax=Umbelopsis ramanniana AG TaxID=1314678 RepID=A0AAD5EC90_UMBRA|nr:uncharacterized protein K450DRAFT_279425 [Umbelopsis ramanniana AG]KAI8581033.1 hypothetical protein K450DRAFT_279425 [Umbelopsis ramanniana AG]